jgi:two-component system response regulator DegU
MNRQRRAPVAAAWVANLGHTAEGRPPETSAQPSDARPKTTRILVIQPYPLFRRGIVSVLEEEPDFEIAGEIDGSSAVTWALHTSPEVVMLELSETARTDAIQTSQRIRQEWPSASIVMLADREDQETLLAALAAGAKAVIPRNTGPNALVAALRRVVSGEDLIGDQILAKPAVALHVIDEFRTLAFANQESTPTFGPLSFREVEILDHLAQGMSNREVAQALSVSVHTVKNHMTNILRKLSAKRRAQAVTYAMRRGWISPP